MLIEWPNRPSYDADRDLYFFETKVDGRPMRVTFSQETIDYGHTTAELKQKAEEELARYAVVPAELLITPMDFIPF